MTVENLGLPGNASMGTVINSPALVSPGGVGGLIGNAYTNTTANFTMPAVNATVNVQVVASAWAAVGQPIFVQGAGFFGVNAIPDATHLTLTNLGYAVNAVPTTVIASPQPVVPTGFQGPTGATGVASLNAISPTTTKGDLIVDNGANHPLASDVRLGVGSDGKSLVADSSQSTGLNYVAITPNTVATAGDIPIFSAAAGTPTPLQDSKMLISSTGALQSTPSGGSARGTSAVDLQPVRGANSQVASGTSSTIGGGQNNTASSNYATVAGGSGNQSSAQGAFSAGENNVASGTDSVALGAGCTASQTACVAIGNGSTASSNDATVGGGLNNTASGVAATVPGGSGNSATGNGSIATGENSKAYLFGQRSHAAGQQAAQGDAQISDLIMRNTTGDATPTELFLNGAFTSLRAVIPINTTWAFHIIGVGRSSAGVCAAFEVKGALQNNSATVSLVAAVTTTVVADGTGSTWGVAGGFVVTADNTNKSLKITVTGAVATNISWMARVHLTEVAF